MTILLLQSIHRDVADKTKKWIKVEKEQSAGLYCLRSNKNQNQLSNWRISIVQQGGDPTVETKNTFKGKKE